MRPHELFEILATATWHTIDRAYRNRISFGEDAITSINLNSLASAGLANIVIEDTRVDEADKGCDFELWVGNDITAWSRYALQAKKLSVSRNNYGSLDHGAGGRRQIDILDEYAGANRALALYCFSTI